MNVWVLIDDRGCVLALNPNDMTGNSGWIGSTVEALGLSVDSDLHDQNGAALYKLVDGAAILRADGELQSDVADDGSPASLPLEQRVDVLEVDTATLSDAVNILLGVDGDA